MMPKQVDKASTTSKRSQKFKRKGRKGRDRKLRELAPIPIRDAGKIGIRGNDRPTLNQEGQQPNRRIDRSTASRPAFDSVEKSDRVVRGAGGRETTTTYRQAVVKSRGASGIIKQAKLPSARNKYTAT